MLNVKYMFLLHDEEIASVGPSTYGVDFTITRTDGRKASELTTFEDRADFFALADILQKFIRVRLHLWDEFRISGHDLQAMYGLLEQFQEKPFETVRFTFSPRTKAVALRTVTEEEVREAYADEEWLEDFEYPQLFWPPAQVESGVVISRQFTREREKEEGR